MSRASEISNILAEVEQLKRGTGTEFNVRNLTDNELDLMIGIDVLLMHEDDSDRPIVLERLGLQDKYNSIGHEAFMEWYRNTKVKPLIREMNLDEEFYRRSLDDFKVWLKEYVKQNIRKRKEN